MDMSFQLFSARKYDLGKTLETLGRLGYRHVEGYGGYDYQATDGGLGGLYGDVAGLKAALDRNGLTMPTAHMGLDLLETPQRAIEVAHELGVEIVICPWVAPADRPVERDEWDAFAERLARLALPFEDAGFTFAYHNHDFEFAPLADGRYPMDQLLEVAGNIGCELDVAWLVRGGADPMQFFEKWGHRIVALHVKDLAPAGEARDEDGWADVGQGVLPWSRLLNQAKAATGARYFVAEHDNPSDVERFARRSLAAINSFGV